MGNKILIITISILLLLAIVLGYAIYSQRLGTTSSGESQSAEVKAPVGPDSRPQGGSSQPNLPTAEELGITPEEFAAIDVPAPDASVEEKQKHFEAVQRVARDASYLDITKCEIADPVVLKVRDGVEVRNQDDVAHTIVMDANNQFTIPAGATKQIKPNFLHGPGAYGYGCDQVPHAVGMFLVIQ